VVFLLFTCFYFKSIGKGYFDRPNLGFISQLGPEQVIKVSDFCVVNESTDDSAFVIVIMW
jgi:hypothetical protein